MEKLTEKRVDEIFKECEWPYKEWCNLKLNADNAPEVARLLIPLPTGMNAVSFHPDRLKENKEVISNFLDQIAWISEKMGVSLIGLSRLNDGTMWTIDILKVQKLYLLGVATDQLMAIPVNGNITIGRITPEKAVVDLVTLDEENKPVILERKIGNK